MPQREHLGEGDLVTKLKRYIRSHVSLRNLLTAALCPANRSRPVWKVWKDLGQQAENVPERVRAMGRENQFLGLIDCFQAEKGTLVA